MNFDRAVELLPWYLNGSLDDEERRQVEELLANSQELRGELEATRRAGRIFLNRPRPEEMVDHLTGRPLLAERAAAVESYLGSPEGEREKSLVERSWQKLEAPDARASAPLDAGDQGAGGQVAGGQVVQGPWTAKRWRVLTQVAAAVATIGLAGWLWSGMAAGRLEDQVAGLERDSQSLAQQVGELADRLADAEQAQRRGTEVRLTPRQVLRSGDPGDAPTVLPDRGKVRVDLAVSGILLRGDRVPVTILSADGETLLTLVAEYRPDDAEVSFHLLGEQLPPGPVTIRLQGEEGETLDYPAVVAQR